MVLIWIWDVKSFRPHFPNHNLLKDRHLEKKGTEIKKKKQKNNNNPVVRFENTFKLRQKDHLIVLFFGMAVNLARHT